MQVTYSDGTVRTHGNNRGRPSNPDRTLAFFSDEILTGIFGSASDVLYGLGFTTSQGRSVGPWGGTKGTRFTAAGHVAGFFGVVLSGNLAGVGVYTLESSRVQGSPIGAPLGADSVVWDDGPSYAGAYCACALQEPSPLPHAQTTHARIDICMTSQACMMMAEGFGKELLNDRTRRRRRHTSRVHTTHMSGHCTFLD